MAYFVEFPTTDGGTILVEVAGEEDGADQEGVIKARLGEKVQHAVLAVRETFEETMMQAVRRNADAFVQTMRSLSEPPTEAELVFGIKAIGEAGYAAVAKAGAESSYTVTLTWKREMEDKDSKQA